MRRLECCILTFGVVLAGCGQLKNSPNQKQAATSQSVLSPRDVFEMKMRCAEIGRRYESEQKSPMRAWYGYSEKLNTCLYRGISDEGGKGFEDRIIDLATGKFLVVFDGGRLYGTTKDEFRKAAMELTGFDPYSSNETGDPR